MLFDCSNVNNLQDHCLLIYLHMLDLLIFSVDSLVSYSYSFLISFDAVPRIYSHEDVNTIHKDTEK